MLCVCKLECECKLTWSWGNLRHPGKWTRPQPAGGGHAGTSVTNWRRQEGRTEIARSPAGGGPTGMQGGPRRRASTHSPLPEVAPSGTIVAVVVLSNRMVKSYEDLNAPRRRLRNSPPPSGSMKSRSGIGSMAIPSAPKTGRGSNGYYLVATTHLESRTGGHFANPMHAAGSSNPRTDHHPKPLVHQGPRRSIPRTSTTKPSALAATKTSSA